MRQGPGKPLLRSKQPSNTCEGTLSVTAITVGNIRPYHNFAPFSSKILSKSALQTREIPGLRSRGRAPHGPRGQFDRPCRARLAVVPNQGRVHACLGEVLKPESVSVAVSSAIEKLTSGYPATRTRNPDHPLPVVSAIAVTLVPDYL
jgi:hypothetical protein